MILAPSNGQTLNLNVNVKGFEKNMNFLIKILTPCNKYFINKTHNSIKQNYRKITKREIEKDTIASQHRDVMNTITYYILFIKLEIT